MTKYFVMMAVRVVCFLLMVLITPYGWYTWVLAIGAVFLPYFAVVIANVGQDAREPHAISPERALTSTITPVQTTETKPTVIRLPESRPPTDP